MDSRSNPEQLAHSPAWRKILRFYQTLKPGIWAMRLPLIGIWLQKVWIPRDADANWFIPVNESIPTGQRYVLPQAMLEHLLERADGIFAMHACPCRTAFACQLHPSQLGCLHLGPAVYRIPGEVGELVSLERAKTHLAHALSGGLVPTILHMTSEAQIFQVEKTNLLSICFCCECCCDVRMLLREGPERYWDLYNYRLPGVQILVDENCTLCGSCIEACYGGERVIRTGMHKIEISERCIGCGLCVPACPQEAISLHIDPEIDLVEELLERISKRVKINTTGQAEGSPSA